MQGERLRAVERCRDRGADAEARMLTAAVASDEAYFDDLRARDFSRLARTGEAYLDYTGSAPLHRLFDLVAAFRE